MTPFALPNKRVINLDTVTHAEWSTWQTAQPDGSIPSYYGLIVHFVGGTRLKLIGADAITVAQKLGLA